MPKIKKTFLRLFGGFLAFIFSVSTVSAQLDSLNLTASPVYGIEDRSRAAATFWEKALYLILSPVFIIAISVLACLIGVFVFIKKRKKKNAEKNN